VYLIGTRYAAPYAAKSLDHYIKPIISTPQTLNLVQQHDYLMPLMPPTSLLALLDDDDAPRAYAAYPQINRQAGSIKG
jgi:hypothetical protein